MLGVLLWLTMLQVGMGAFPVLRQTGVLWGAAVLGAVVGRSRFRPLLWAAGAVLAAVLLLFSLTPLAVPLDRSLVRADHPAPTDAVIVVTADISPEANLRGVVRRRLRYAAEELRAGRAPRLVLVPPPEPVGLDPAAQLRLFGVDVPVEVAAPAADLRQAARQTATLARERGWRRVTLVTGLESSRRAAATFEQAGLPVRSAPAGRYTVPDEPDERLGALQNWMEDRIRGWLDRP